MSLDAEKTTQPPPSDETLSADGEMVASELDDINAWMAKVCASFEEPPAVDVAAAAPAEESEESEESDGGEPERATLDGQPEASVEPEREEPPEAVPVEGLEPSVEEEPSAAEEEPSVEEESEQVESLETVGPVAPIDPPEPAGPSEESEVVVEVRPLPEDEAGSGFVEELQGVADPEGTVVEFLGAPQDVVELDVLPLVATEERGATEPDATEPDATEQETAAPDIAAPQPGEPERDAPESAAPESGEPDATAPEPAEPHPTEPAPTVSESSPEPERQEPEEPPVAQASESLEPEPVGSSPLPAQPEPPVRPAGVGAAASGAAAQPEPSAQSVQAAKRVGGKLRSLGDALSTAEPGRVPAGIEKRATAAVRFLASVENTQRAVVLVTGTGGAIQAVAAGGMEGGDSLSQIPVRLLKSVLSTKRSLMVIDCLKDTRFNRDRSVAQNNVRSVICVPFQDIVSRTGGLLYIDNTSRADAFSYADLERVERFAVTLATQAELGQWEPPPVTTAATPIEVEREPISPWLYVLAALMLMIFALPSLTNQDEQFAALEATTVVTHDIADPETVLRTFIRNIETGGYSGAYALLSTQKRHSMTVDDFENRVKEFLSKSNNSERFATLEISPKRPSPEEPTATVGSEENRREFLLKARGSNARPWVWQLHREDGTWYLSSLKGGPPI